MATGVIGGIILGILGLKGMHSAWVILKSTTKARWIALLYVQALVGCMFSGSLYSSPEFWIMTAGVVAANACRYREVRSGPEGYDVKVAVAGPGSRGRKPDDHLSQCSPSRLSALVKGWKKWTSLWRRCAALNGTNPYVFASPGHWMACSVTFGKKTAVVARRVRQL